MTTILATLLDEVGHDAELDGSDPHVHDRGPASGDSIAPRDFVKWVQRALNRRYRTKLVTDGKITSAYRAAVARFNEEYLGRKDGNVDRATQDQLIYVGEVDGDYVRWVVAALVSAGFGPLVPTSTSTAPVVKAIEDFQRAKGLRVDGYVGPGTELALIAAGDRLPPGEHAAKVTPPKPVRPKPRPPAPRGPEPSAGAIRGFTWAILGQAPSEVAWKAALRAAASFAKILAGLLVFSSTGVSPTGLTFPLLIRSEFDVERQNKPYVARGMAMGMAYAVVDFVSGGRRAIADLRSPSGIRPAFSKRFHAGYHWMRTRMWRMKGRSDFEALAAGLRRVTDKAAAVGIVYDAVLGVIRRHLALEEFPIANAASRHCNFGYPVIKACCSPNPGCRPGL